MDDSSTMTIEFLRARLLSERAVSKAAKERAEQLTKRVVELEEQLRLVIAQRKMAEKETMEVLSILEAHGVDGPFEVVDSSSEGDDVSNSEKAGSQTLKGDEVPTASKTDMNGAEDANSSSEPGGSPLQAGSLSWKRHSTSPDSQRKLKAKQLRQWQRRLRLMSSEPSPKYSLGKSCRKVKQKQMGLSIEDEGENDTSLDACEQREISRSDCADDQLDLSMEASGSESCSLDVQNKEGDGSHYAIDSSARDEEMERLLEQQAQLIGQYEAEEKAQREWEEKYNENNSPNMDYSGLGNQCHIAEKKFEQQKQSSEVLSIIPYEDEEEKVREGVHPNTNKQVTGTSSDEDHPVTKTLFGQNQEMTNGDQGANAVMLSNSIEPIVSTRASSGSDPLASRDDLMGQIQTMTANITDSGALASVGKKNQNLLYENSDSGSSNDVGHNHMNFSLSTGRDLTSDSRRDTSKGSWNRQNQHQVLVSQTSGSSLGGILEDLQRAKISLRRELQKSHLSAQTDYHSKTAVPDETLKIPVGSAGLFRLPTDAIEQAQIPNSEIYTSRSSLPITYPDFRHATTTKYSGYPSTSYTEVGSGDFIGNRYFNTYSSGMALTASSRYSLGYPELAKDTPLSYGSRDSKENATTTKYNGYSNASSTEVRPSDFIGNRYSSTYSSGMALPASSRYSLGYSDLTKENMPFPYGSGDSDKPHFPTYAHGSGVPASSQYLSSELTTEGKLLNGYGVSGNKQYSNNAYLGMGMPNVSRYSLPHSELPSDRTFTFDRISKPNTLLFRDGNSIPDRALFRDLVSVPHVDMRNAMPTADRYSLYNNNGLQSDKRFL